MTEERSCEICRVILVNRKRFCSNKCYHSTRKGIKQGGHEKKPRQPCITCGLECKRSTTKYCTRSCYRKHKAQIIKEPKVEVVKATKARGQNLASRTCPTCQKKFFPNNYKAEQKFCTRHCMGLARREECATLGRGRKGTKYGPEVRARMSEGASKRLASTSYTKGIGGTREDLGHYCRSSWEANYARYLKHIGTAYEFEPDRFALVKADGLTTHYTPDFKLPDGSYVEVKGWWNERSLLLKDLMAAQYPEIQISYIADSEYQKLEVSYKDRIDGWEDSRRK